MSNQKENAPSSIAKTSTHQSNTWNAQQVFIQKNKSLKDIQPQTQWFISVQKGSLNIYDS